MVPSTYSENGGTVVIRSVGYNHNGTTPSTSGGAASTTYYCTNAPTERELVKCRGELFLGSYSYDGTEHRSDGIDFGSRPLTLSFKYKYKPVNNEAGEAYVNVYNASDKMISQGIMRLPEATVFTSKTIELELYDFGEKAAKIQIGFKSTATSLTPAINIPSGSDLNEGTRLGNQTKSANNYKAFAMGSELVIDDVVLGYDPPALVSGQTSKPKRNIKRR